MNIQLNCIDFLFLFSVKELIKQSHSLFSAQTYKFNILQDAFLDAHTLVLIPSGAVEALL